MPKLSEAGITRKISLSQIVETGNVREDYSDIEDLAASIKKNTLLEPILVKITAPGEDGEARYELIAGHRRVLAHKYLKEKGDDFESIEAKIVTGDKLTLQLVENLQRSDLTPRDREKAIWQMSEIPGVTQRDIAAELSKTETYVSRHVSAYKTRKIAEEAGINTESLETSAMSELQTAEEKDIPMLIQYTLNGGGTVAAARAVMRDYRPPKKNNPPPVTIEAPSDMTVKNAGDVEKILGIPGESLTERPPADPMGLPHGDPEPKQKESPAPGAAPHKHQPRQGIEHKEVILNDVFNEIYGYITALEKRIRDLGPDADQAKIDGYKKEAAVDIISLIQKRFEE